MKGAAIIVAIAVPVFVGAATVFSLRVYDGYLEGTVVKEYREGVEHGVKCGELRAEFFGECQKTMSRQQCEALYGQTRGHLFDGAPHLPFVKELDCSK